MSDLVEELKKKLKKLKDKEVMLEADLAIKESPELEDAIIELMVLAGDVKRIKAARSLVAIASPTTSKAITEQISAHQRMISFYESKIETLRLMIVALAGSDGSKYTELVGQESKARDLVKTAVETWQTAFDAVGVNIFQLLPAVSDAMPDQIK